MDIYVIMDAVHPEIWWTRTTKQVIPSGIQRVFLLVLLTGAVTSSLAAIWSLATSSSVRFTSCQMLYSFSRPSDTFDLTPSMCVLEYSNYRRTFTQNYHHIIQHIIHHVLNIEHTMFYEGATLTKPVLWGVISTNQHIKYHCHHSVWRLAFLKASIVLVPRRQDKNFY